MRRTQNKSVAMDNGRKEWRSTPTKGCYENKLKRSKMHAKDLIYFRAC